MIHLKTPHVLNLVAFLLNVHLITTKNFKTAEGRAEKGYKAPLILDQQILIQTYSKERNTKIKKFST